MNKSQVKEDFSLEALRQGDRVEFARLVEAYSAMIYRLGLKMLTNSQDAEDILQETFIKAYHHLKDFDGRSSLSTWLYRIATNEALMILRRKQPVMVPVDDEPEMTSPLEKGHEIVDWCCLPEDELLSTESRANLDLAIDKLSPALRAVFVLRDIEGLPTSEVSELLNLTETTVKTRLSRARMQLRAELTAYFGKRLAGGEHALS